MRRFVNGVDAELHVQPEVQVTRQGDHLIVRGPDGAHSAAVARLGSKVFVSYRGRVFVVEEPTARARSGGAVHSGEIRAPMPGQIVDVMVSEGQSVAKGDRLFVLEAMKTQQPFVSPFDGTVMKLGAVKGEQVQEGDILARIEASAEPV